MRTKTSKDSSECSDKKNTKCHISLSPRDDIDIGIYEKRIDSILEDERCLNIAITGSYGAGKSSLINTYEKKRKAHFTRISLAHFSSTHDNTKNEANPVDRQLETERILEGKILNQLIHQTDTKRIPLTKFSIKNPPNKIIILAYCFALLFFILSFVSVICYDDICSFVFGNRDSIPVFLRSVGFKTIIILLFLCLTFFLSYKLMIYCISFSRIKKLSFKGNEIELFTSDKDSFFDKYLSEILYILINQESDVIVFEDIDRFNDNRIFERLREINTLANHKINDIKHPRNKKNTKATPQRHIRFIYLLRDDMFLSKDRTKFFDVIIPVVPVINGSNSYDVFLKELDSYIRKEKGTDGIDKDFLLGASIYVDEMRLLLNICQEFCVYNDAINKGHLDKSKLLAIVIYKNLFPKDFDELQSGRGFLYQILHEKDKLKQLSRETIQKDIDSLNTRIEKANNEIANNITELTYLFGGMKINSNYRYGIDIFRNLERYLSKEELQDYNSRIQCVNDKQDLLNGHLNDERNELLKKLEDIEAIPFRELVKMQYDSMESFLSDPNKSWTKKYDAITCSVYYGYIKFSIGNGYIDDRYCDYIQYFQGYSIGIEDKRFITNVLENNKMPWDYKLSSPSLILESIGSAFFSNEAILNHDLIHELFRMPEYNEKKKRLITLLRNIHNIEFIDLQWRYSDIRRELTECLATWWPGFFEELIKYGIKYFELAKEYSYVALSSLNEDKISDINKNSILSTFISQSQNYLCGLNGDIEILKKNLTKLSACIVSIPDEECMDGLLDMIYQNNLYVINYHNIRTLIKMDYGITNEEIIKHKNYSSIRGNQKSPLFCYINDNFEHYFNCYIDFCDGSIFDDENDALEIINTDCISEGTKSSYLSFYKNKITDIRNIEKRWWSLALSYRVVLCSVNNIYHCLLSPNFSENVISFINDEEIDFKLTDAVEDIKTFFYSLIKSDKLDDIKYINLIRWTGQKITSSLSDKISDDKMRILISQKIIEFNEDTLRFVKSEYKACVGVFIENHLNKTAILKRILGDSGLIETLKSEIHICHKKEIVDMISKPIPIAEQSYPDELLAYIIEQEYEYPDDFPTLCILYDSFSIEVQDQIKQRIINNPSLLFEELSNSSLGLRKSILTYENMERRLHILSSIVSSLEKKEVLYYLEIIGEIRLKNKIEGSKSKCIIYATTDREEFLGKLSDAGYIKSYENREGKIKVYP